MILGDIFIGRVFKTRHFARWMRKTALTDQALCLAVTEMAQGLVDADLGSGVLKKRVALPGRGKRGGTRTLVASYQAARWFFVFGFEKNEKANVSRLELEVLKEIAAALLALDEHHLNIAVADGTLEEICHDG